MLALGLACLAAASGSSGPPTSPSPSTSFSTYQSAHLTFRYTAMDAASVVQTAATVEAEFTRITDDLGVTEMPRVVVTLYPNIDALRQAVTPLVGSIPSFASGLVTGVDAVHILSPNLASAWPYRDGVTNIVHEFAHCVSIRLNPSIPNNPRWLWESVALFEALQYDEARTRPIVTAGPLPTLAQLSSFDNTAVYGVGASLAHFIVETRGWETYRAFIRANGDLARVLNTTEAAFLDDWAAFVRASLH